MFGRLGAIPWADLTHAYGSAEEMPMWLRQLTSDDAQVRKAAIQRFVRLDLPLEVLWFAEYARRIGHVPGTREQVNQ